ncbi:DUF58 domain-containing protein [Akkermansiaceae bacterium]|nr:DUF58 domain-containing protein [Akkermansiaceae bacterium]
MKDQFQYQSIAEACAERVTLPFSKYLWNGQHGEFGGNGTGSSMDFQDHKEYAPGDDPRYINWSAYARTGSYIIKQFREEVRPSLDLIIDVSPSMFFEEQKRQRTCELVYLIHSIAKRNGAEIQVHVATSSVCKLIDPDQLNMGVWLEKIEKMENMDRSDNASTQPNLHHANFRANSIRVLISDLLFVGDPSDVLQPLLKGQGKPVLLVPYLKSEENPDWEGNYDFIDVEADTKHQHRIDSTTLQQYKKLYLSHFSLWIDNLQRYQTKMAKIPAEGDLFEALSKQALAEQIFSIT